MAVQWIKVAGIAARSARGARETRGTPITRKGSQAEPKTTVPEHLPETQTPCNRPPAVWPVVC